MQKVIKKRLNLQRPALRLLKIRTDRMMARFLEVDLRMAIGIKTYRDVGDDMTMIIYRWIAHK